MPWFVSPRVYPVWNSLYFLDLIDYFLFHGREVFDYNCFKNFLKSFIFLFFFCRCCSVTQSSPTLCNPVDCSTPGFLVLHHLPELAQTHVHWVRIPMIWMLICLLPDVSETILNSFHSFFFILLLSSYFHHSFSSLIHSSA